jgi:hypothetical protein
MERARACGQVIAEHGDALFFRSKRTREAINSLAEGIAILACQPGGVAFCGTRWIHDQGRLIVEPAEALWARMEATRA